MPKPSPDYRNVSNSAGTILTVRNIAAGRLCLTATEHYSVTDEILLDHARKPKTGSTIVANAPNKESPSDTSRPLGLVPEGLTVLK